MTESMQILVGLVADARSKLKRFDHPEQAEAREVLGAALERLERALHRRPVVLVAGEANAGKTSIANMLAGLDVLPSAVIANTAVPVRLRHGVVPSVTAVTSRGRIPLAALAVNEPLPKFLYTGLDRIEIALPGMRHAGFEILDTPATHGVLEFCDEADILIWCSVAVRPWTESERRALSAAPARLRQRSLLAVTHKDALSASEGDRVLARYEEFAGPHVSKIVMVDAATRRFDDTVGASDEPPGDGPAKSGSDAEHLPAGGAPATRGSVRIGQGDQAELFDALDDLVDDYWNHRAVTGRRLCRHIARSLRPLLPGPAINATTAPKNDPAAIVLSNIAARLASV